MSKQKRIIHGQNNKTSKTTVRVDASSEGEKVIFLFDRIDRDGKFAFDVSRADFDHKGFLQKVIDYSGMTWAEVRRQTHDAGKSKHHYLTEVSRYSQEAQDRIEKLGLMQDTDRIYSFALGNKLRIIGLREREKFHVVWYDSNHEFYPSSRE